MRAAWACVLVVAAAAVAVSALTDAQLAEKATFNVSQAVRLQAAPPWQRGGWTQTWNDEFDLGKLDLTKWSLGYGFTTAVYHNSRCVLDDSMVEVSNGQLHLKASHTRSAKAPNDYWSNEWSKWMNMDWIAGAVHTANTLRMSQGYIEVQAKMPNIGGFWPAVWLLGNGWPPEIDILEHLSETPGQYHYNYHYTVNGAHNAFGAWKGGPSLQNSFHIFGMEWSATAASPYIRFFFDNAMVAEWTNANVNQAKSMFLQLDFGVGGWAADPAATTSAAQMDVEWVRVWTPNA